MRVMIGFAMKGMFGNRFAQTCLNMLELQDETRAWSRPRLVSLPGCEKLAIVHGRGTEFADDDTRRAIGQRDGIDERYASAEHRGKRGDHGIARARHIVDLARERRCV